MTLMAQVNQRREQYTLEHPPALPLPYPAT
jgi:hypothetical protein